MEAIRRCVARGQLYRGKASRADTQSNLSVPARRYPRSGVPAKNSSSGCRGMSTRLFIFEGERVMLVVRVVLCPRCGRIRMILRRAPWLP